MHVVHRKPCNEPRYSTVQPESQIWVYNTRIKKSQIKQAHYALACATSPTLYSPNPLSNTISRLLHPSRHTTTPSRLPLIIITWTILSPSWARRALIPHPLEPVRRIFRSEQRYGNSVYRRGCPAFVVETACSVEVGEEGVIGGTTEEVEVDD